MDKNWRGECFSACRKHKSEFLESVKNTPLLHSSALPSEVLLFCSLAVELGAVGIIESGRKFGYSTELIARFLENKVDSFTSIDNSPNRESDKRIQAAAPWALLSRGDGAQYILGTPTESCAVFMDGPKGTVAVNIMKEIRGKCPLVAIHDLHKGSNDRQEAERLGGFFSDDREFIQEFGDIDKQLLEYRGYQSHGDLLGEANVIGVFKGL